MRQIEIYHAGYDCGVNGPNEVNCYYGFFATPEFTAVWEKGKAGGEAARKLWRAVTQLDNSPAKGNLYKCQSCGMPLNGGGFCINPDCNC